jgi:hypothetical protein|tara:strand:+ start:4997 stop:6757 length:1761 start_codon:yes stop_codon:yes gene_type:complete
MTEEEKRLRREQINAAALEELAAQNSVSEVPDWADVPGQALSNLGSSGAQFADDIWNMVTSPIETGKSLYNLAAGAAQKLIPDSWTDGPMGKEKYADALGRFFAERYGSEDEIKRTLATDPVGVLADFSAFLTGGATAAAKLPMIASQASRLTGAVPRLSQASQTVGNVARAVEPAVRQAADVVGNVGKWMDPLYTTARAAGGLGKAAVLMPEALLGQYSGVGVQPIRQAAAAGYEGGESASTFRGTMRGEVDYEQAVADAIKGLNQLKSDKNQAYAAGIADIGNDPAVLDFARIEAALAQAKRDNTFEGIPKSKDVETSLKEIEDLTSYWGQLDASRYHTPMGLDALKQRIGSLIDWNGKSKQKNLPLQAMYAEVGGIIRKQAPAYDKLMKDYSEASRLIMEIEKTMGLGKNASTDSSLRKLTSIMRNNVNTNYGARLAHANTLETASGKPLMSSLAGLSMNSITPRGLAGTSTGSLIPVLAGAATGSFLPLAAIPFQSPRLIGELAHGTGRFARRAGSKHVVASAGKGARMRDALLDKGVSARGTLASAYQLQRSDEEHRHKTMTEEEKRLRREQINAAALGNY